MHLARPRPSELNAPRFAFVVPLIENLGLFLEVHVRCGFGRKFAIGLGGTAGAEYSRLP
jgi:hypothetical protein